MIAQELVLRHPARVDRLVLGAITPGGHRAIAPDGATGEFFGRRATMTAEQASTDAATLVVHGVEDRMVPVENARVIADAIPGAVLELGPDAAHLYPTDELQANRQVAAFLTAS